MDKRQKSENLAHWAYGNGRLIVAINALGLGIDVPDILAVVHAERPGSLIEYGQESGRAGRGGQISEAVIVDSGKRWMRAVTENDEGNEQAEKEMDKFMSGQHCRRAVLDRYMDGDRVRVRCVEGEGEVVCDICEAESAVERRERGQGGEQEQEQVGEQEQGGEQEQQRLLNTFEQQQRARSQAHERVMHEVLTEILEVMELERLLER